MKILILGGTGAMGSFLVPILASSKHEVYVTSRSNRQTNINHIHYIQGNAHDNEFLDKILCELYDVIIDFMVYENDELFYRLDTLLSNTKQYIFTSSCRVYADSETSITEDSSRILNKCFDETYLNTDEYALRKARQEDILKNSKYTNWTIIRPYITYSNERLQLGMYEKEHWLYRALLGKTIVFSKDIAYKYTTLTFGFDVAQAISKIIGNPKSLGEIIQIVSNETLTWENVLMIYLDVLEEITFKRPKVLWLDNASKLTDILNNQYQVKYDRIYNRRFKSSKLDNIINYKICYKKVNDGLRECLSEFINNPHDFRQIDWKFEGYLDKLTSDKTSLRSIPEIKNKIKYMLWRYILI